MLGDPRAGDRAVRFALIRDLKMTSRMGDLIRSSIRVDPTALIGAVEAVLPQPLGAPSREFSTPRELPGADEWWFEMVVEQPPHMRQQIHYHLLQGHLLVDGQPPATLPPEYQQSSSITCLFDDLTFFTYPSPMPGMTHTLFLSFQGHQVHVGRRDGNTVVRACIGDSVLELIPPEVFGHPGDFDLPASLIHGYHHWLDVKSGILEIRPKVDTWRRKQGNWRLDLHTGIAKRYQKILINPRSLLFQRVARIFDSFETPYHLELIQPSRGPLSLYLHRLELSFTVNKKNFLQSRELRQEIDPNQDAGTWYGLRSKLILRDPDNTRKRNILVPFGTVTPECSGIHMAVRVIDPDSRGGYGRFVINDLLGRIDCAAEPKLLYLKVLLHACTSFVVVDPLTGQTGTEEAIDFLQSAICQPWAPVSSAAHKILAQIASLTASREYYPADLQQMQRVHWSPHLTTTVQHDSFWPIVQSIVQKSEDLAAFAQSKVSCPTEVKPIPEPHLRSRGFWRRSIFERQVTSLSHDKHCDQLYVSRGRRHRDEFSQKVKKLKMIANCLRERSSTLPLPANLAGILQNWSNIGGFDDTFNKRLLSDQIKVNLALEWGSLVRLFRDSDSQDTHSLMFLTSVMCFCNDVDMDIMRVLVAFATLSSLKEVPLSNWNSFVAFRHNQTPRLDYLLQLIRPYGFPYGGDLREEFSNLSAKQRKTFEAREQAWTQSVEQDCNTLVKFLLAQWPCQEPSLSAFSCDVKIDIRKALEVVLPEWFRLFQNLEFSKWIDHVQGILDQHQGGSIPLKHTVRPDESEPLREPSFETPTLTHRFCLQSTFATKSSSNQYKSSSSSATGGQKENVRPPTKNVTKSESRRHAIQPNPQIRELEKTVRQFSSSQSIVRRRYSEDLLRSINALKKVDRSQNPDTPILTRDLDDQVRQAEMTVRTKHSKICEAIDGNDAQTTWLRAGGIWPCTKATAILQQIRSTSPVTLGQDMKERIVDYALSITALQQLLRIQHATKKNKYDESIEEQQNPGHSNWNPCDHPDWLLLEIDSDILIRPIQVEVARETAFPSSNQNSVLQMNMGQGKTSVIMPMVVVHLADSKNLLRICVPRALLLQTAQLLHSRLGGLVGRELKHIPFSRKTLTTSANIKKYFELHKGLLKSQGFLITLPEHIMSFILSGRQRLSDQRISEAVPMIRIQDWLRKNCRDVLDECDFTLAVKTQLIYANGHQRPLDGFPHRWETAQILLRLVEGHLWSLLQKYPYSIVVIARESGSYPFVHFLNQDVENALLQRLVSDVCSGRIPILPLMDCSDSEKEMIRTFISSARVSPELNDQIRLFWPDKLAARKTLYLLRGLLVHRILIMTLKRRWNVQYGLHPHRDPVAVPFHAKGVPSEQAEWGHPDVSVLFTCLSFYYGGLSLDQLRRCLEAIAKSDDPAGQYDRWTSDSHSLPDSLREWNAINVEDEFQMMDLWRCLRTNMTAIDYLLNNFVFPKHARQFPLKLQASGWDLPIVTAGTRTSGFSGTNDNRSMLPLTIKQNDLRSLSHVNAEVLTYLLQQRCQFYQVVEDKAGQFSEMSLLRRMSRMKLRVLINAGAHILEMDNRSLAKQWLREDTDARAALYFNSDNKAVILHRNATDEVPFLASPFVDNLTDVLVYLDEAHTRGTDLKFPRDARAALTLGLGMTKDALVQAAMRMRQLGTTQSVGFFTSREVHQSIKDARRKPMGFHIDSADVIYWLLAQTCDSIEQLQPLFFSQGAEYCRRTQAELDNPNIQDDADQREEYVRSIQQSEQKTLIQLYGPKQTSASGLFPENPSTEVAALVKELQARRKDFHDTGTAVHGSALQEVEQERETEVQQEVQREVQKPVQLTPLKFSGLHGDILKFAQTGRLVATSHACEQVFSALKKTGVGIKYGVESRAMSSKFYVSREFLRTVELQSGRQNDTFQRPVNWILINLVTETALIVNPEEAETLIPIVRHVKPSNTHLLTYATPITRKMSHFNRLSFFAMPDLPNGWTAPEWLQIELGIFAGRLYFEWSEYSRICEYVGIKPNSDDERAPEGDMAIEGTGDGLENGTEQNCTTLQLGPFPFTAKPLVFLQQWLAVRRKGQEFANTPMGYVCHGKPLSEDHPFFRHPREPSDSGYALGGCGPQRCLAEEVVDSADEEDDVDEVFEE
ncbi:MAG: hypothetical protein M1821_005225 [Bathelium mastoideum]|nr:MAG: hypothetical protein M1821_005225 [Bathelium mastoideum]